MNCKKLLLGLFALIFASLTVSAQIQPRSTIQITIANVPDEDQKTVNGLYPVAENGMINMPYINKVRAAGLQNDQLASVLQEAYKRAEIYTRPTIQVISSADGAKPVEEIVTVGGFVRAPGRVPFINNLTLWGAIQAAGNATEFGSMQRVQLTRNGKVKTYDVTKPEYQQIPLERNDAINVPQKNWTGG